MLAAFSLSLPGAPKTEWKLVKSQHFEVYSHSGDRDARNALEWLERLRAFFIQAGVTKLGGDLDGRGSVRVIGFASAAEYVGFRPHPNADAYFLSGEARDYLVLPELRPQDFGMAAHEYAHLALRSLDVRLPPWLAEGIAEFFSTVRIRDTECSIGGDVSGREIVLRQNTWVPLTILFSAKSPMQSERARTSLFYAESWAVTDMLIFSPEYAPRLSDLLSALGSGSPDPETVARVYGRRLDQMLADAQRWMAMPRSAVPLPGVPSVKQRLASLTLTEFESRSVLGRPASRLRQTGRCGISVPRTCA